MDYKYVWQDNILTWDEAVPLGSGQCGCLCWGTPRELRFSLDRTDIWDSTVLWEKPEDFTYQKLVELADAGEEKAIREIFDAPYYYPSPTKLPAGKLLVHFKGGDRMVSTLSLKEACAWLSVREKEELYRIRTWIHALRHVGMVEIYAPKDSFSVELKTPGFGVKGTEKAFVYSEENRQISQGSLTELKYAPAKWGEEKKGDYVFQWFTQEITEDFSYGIVTAREDREERTRLAWKIVSSKDGGEWLLKGQEELSRALDEEEESLFAEHKKWWEEYFGESSVSLPDQEMEKQWYTSNYLFAAASRKGCAPMPLQGVWTADDGALPPWKGDYHHDLNTELSYSHYLKANHLEEGECFLDFLWELKSAGKKFAREFYDAPGCCLPGVMTIDGEPLGGWPMYSLSPANQIWIARCFEEYYRYTGNEEFLRNRAYPYLKETGIFIKALLKEQEDGTLLLPVSSSPEIHDDTAKAWLKPVSNYDLALMRYLFKTLEILGNKVGDEEAKEWRKVFDKLPKLAVNEKKVLMISPKESLEESHRHFSNAMAVSPLELIPYEGEGREIIDAVIRDYERLGTSQWVGYTFTWMAHLYGIQGNGEKAAEMLRIFWEYFCGPNGFHLNGDFKAKGYSDFTYRPFTLEGNMFAADALQEMLFQMRDGMIRLFPAIPDEWVKKGTGFSSLRGEKGLFCDAYIKKGEGIRWKITAEHAQKVTVRYREFETENFLEAGEVWESSFPV